MIKKYDLDEEIRRKILRTQYKKHPDWLKKRHVRMVMYIWVLLSGLLGGYYISIHGYHNYKGAEQMLMFISFSLSFGVLASVIPLVYNKYLKQNCVDVLDLRLNESIVLTDEEIQLSYLSKGSITPNVYRGYEISYMSIKRIVYNKYHQRIDIIGTNKEVTYKDYFKGEVLDKRRNKKETSVVRIYLYFNDNEDLLKTVSELSKVKIETINHPEK